MKAWMLVALALTACHKKPAKRRPFGPRFFSGVTHSESHVQCSAGVDKTHEWTHAELREALEHARAEGLVLHTYGHAPTIDLNEFIGDFDWAAANGVKMVTFRDLADGYTGPGWAFSIDDDEVDTWITWRDLFRAHHVRATFFVTNLNKMSPPQLGELHALAADGHDIEAHSVDHAQAVDYVAAHGGVVGGGIAAYLNDQVLPSKAALVAAGFQPIAFAYPYGAHTTAIDDALLPYFNRLRTVGATWCLK